MGCSHSPSILVGRTECTVSSAKKLLAGPSARVVAISGNRELPLFATSHSRISRSTVRRGKASCFLQSRPPSNFQSKMAFQELRNVTLDQIAAGEQTYMFPTFDGKYL